MREGLILVLVFTLLLGGASAYAQQWPPAVIVESSSMMHPTEDVPYGRVGTMDVGDLVLVRAVSSPEDVATLVEGRDHETYGAPGDVIVYRRAGDADQTPIIHRAIAYVVVVEMQDGVLYRVRWDPDASCIHGARKDFGDPRWCVYDGGGVALWGVEGAGRQHLRPERSGFITKGDNPVTNPDTDVALGISRDEAGHPSVVPFEWVEGKARGELPWLGLVKLSLMGRPNEDHPAPSYVKVGSAYAPPDLWIMLFVTLVVLVAAPLAWDAWRARRRRAKNA